MAKRRSTGKRDKPSKGKKTNRQVNLANRLRAYAKQVGAENFSNPASLPKRFGGFNRPGSGKRT